MDRIAPLYADKGPAFSWRAGETIVELDDRPHLLTRIVIEGGFFPHLDAQPFIRVDGPQESFRSWFANVGDDGASIAGYFGVDTPLGDGMLEYGYGNRVFARVGRFAPARIARLDPRRLPKKLVRVTDAFIERKQGGTRAD